MPIEANASAKRNSVQSKCATSRRSICTIFPFEAHVSLIRRLGLELYVFFENLFRQRRSGGASMPSVLDQYNYGDLRILHRGIGNKPCMVPAEIGQLFALQIGALHLHDLRRP